MRLTTCYVVVLVAYVGILPWNASARIAKSTNQLSLLSQCRFFKTRRLKESCFRVGVYPSAIKMEGKVRADHEGYKNYPTATFVVEENTIAPNHTAKAKVGKWQRGANSSLGCRTHLHCDEEIPPSTTSENLRSVSPWDYCNHYDPNR